MTREHEEKPLESAPRGAATADSGAEMSYSPSSFTPADLCDPHTALEALTQWDDLDPRTLTALAADPHHAPRLALLQASERWLADRLSPGQDGRNECPTSDDLYDFGRGPGYSLLAAAQRASIDRHLAACEECEFLVETLASPPPVPLVVSGWTEAGELPERRLRALPSVPRQHPRTWIPVAAAAAALVAFAVWNLAHEPSVERFPGTTLLRGEAGGSLHFPRERVLARTPEIRGAFPVLARGLVFEIEPVPEASAYRVELFRHTGGAFDAGQPILVGKGDTPRIDVAATELSAGTRAAGFLEPAHYTWKAWAVVRGLDQPLGERDFEVVENAALARRLVELVGRPEEERTLGAVRLLDEQGFAGDARVLARELSASPDRDAYLDRAPGR